ncbi:hypothetical protein F9K90_07530 [Brucella anthropi]|uniref:hypothetical protein n=1 Tax=Brucella anthropi TaxID=529 RepID=UPI00124F5BF2|nr:hypothetical protein [Brucella anthropi]KAB2738523.1 hypothetical protein F9K90_07530 [Brucella anthropi]
MMLNNLTYESFLGLDNELGTRKDQRQSKETIDQTKRKIKDSFSSTVKVRAALSAKPSASRSKRQKSN